MIFDLKTGGWVSGKEEVIQGVRWVVSSVLGSLVLQREEGVKYLKHVDRQDKGALEALIMKSLDDNIKAAEVVRVVVVSDKNGDTRVQVQVDYEGERLTV